MAIKNLINHPGMWLREDAADSLARLERDHGVQPVNSAGRTVAEQNAFIQRYAHPTSIYDKPPYLYAPAPSSGPNASRHISGKAVDADTVATDKAMWAEYGFEFLFPYDKIHVEYNPATDKHLHETAPAVKATDNREEIEMIMLNNGTGIGLLTGDALVSLDTKSVQGLSAAGVKAADVTPEVYAKIGAALKK